MCWYNELRYPLSPLRGTFPQGESKFRTGMVNYLWAETMPGNATAFLAPPTGELLSEAKLRGDTMPYATSAVTVWFFIPSPSRLTPCHLPRGGRHFRTGIVGSLWAETMPGNATSAVKGRLFIPSPSRLVPCHLPRGGRLGGAPHNRYRAVPNGVTITYRLKASLAVGTPRPGAGSGLHRIRTGMVNSGQTIGKAR